MKLGPTDLFHCYLFRMIEFNENIYVVKPIIYTLHFLWPPLIYDQNILLYMQYLTFQANVILN